MVQAMTPTAPTPLIVEQTRPLILVGNGDYDIKKLAQFSRRGPVVAVDGGYYGCRLAGLTPDLVIGDMDSLDPQDLADAQNRTRVHPISEQDTTDLEKALRHLKAPLVIGFGFLGKRFDHSLAALSVLANYAHQHRVILMGSDDVVFVTARSFLMPTKKGQRISIWPLGQVAFKRSLGLAWPLDGLVMAPDKQVGTSNKADSEKIEIHPEDSQQGAYALLSELDCLEDMIKSVLAQTG